MNLFKALSSEDLIHSLIPATVALHLTQNTRELGLMALYAWIVLQLVRQIKQFVDQHAKQETLISWGVLLSLVLFNSRNIVLRDNYRGSVIFLLIATGLLIGSHFNQRQWERLLSWLAISIIPIALFFTVHLGQPGGWLLRVAECSGHKEAPVMFCTYYKLVQPSMGSINRLATLMTFLTLASWYCACIAKKSWERFAFLILTAFGYWITLGTDSRMAIIAIPISILLPWLGFRLRERLTSKQILFSLVATATVVAIAAWELVIKHGLGSDVMRLRQISCWIRNGMFGSAERFWMGSGYNTNSLREACHYINPEKSFGHAHNTLAQIAGNHGLLGLIGLGALIALIMNGLWRQNRISGVHLSWLPWYSTTFGEINTALNIALLICAASTTVQEFSPVNQVLIGLVAGSAFPVRAHAPQVATTKDTMHDK